ncbi:MAG: hypothetical protein GXC94_16280 [Comamonadaceae bacterium]|jgi:hypothetical protein|nr:hypothetical protein [Comamonadaceae bacterium]
MLICALLGSSWAGAWEPAPEASGREVLQAARRDALEGRLAEAAEKHLWFHEHVLERQPSMMGVRLSFALADWVALARRYPPAMAQMTAARDHALAQVEAGGPAGLKALNEVLAFNRYLRQPESTREGFNRLALRDPLLAEQALPRVLPALIELNDIELASKHLRVDDAVAHIAELYKLLNTAKSSLSGDQLHAMQRWQQRHMDIQLAQVVYVLCRDRREAEAEQVVARGRALLEPDAPVHHMTQALRCIAPPNDDAG